jgi:hypothetical protein
MFGWVVIRARFKKIKIKKIRKKNINLFTLKIIVKRKIKLKVCIIIEKNT